MKRETSNRALLKTNLFVCAIIILGFLATSIVSYRSNLGVFEGDTEKVTALTSEGIYRQIESIFMKPMGVSLTMANDTLLQDLLTQENARRNDAEFIATLTAYLNSYREKYGYDSVFLVSTRTGRYYHFDGIDRILSPGNEEDAWYYDFLRAGEPCSLNVDNDQAAGDAITVFINCLITDSGGAPLGVVGVGFDISTLQSLLGEYEERFSLRACLVDRDGVIQVATDHTGYEHTDLFSVRPYSDLRESLLTDRENANAFWYDGEEGRLYVGSHYIPSLSWYLLVENDTSVQTRQLQGKMVEGALIALLVVAAVTLAITYIIHTYNRRIVELTRSTEQARRSIFQEATEQLFENIYELDITHNRAANPETQQYFESLGVPPRHPLQRGAENRGGKADTGGLSPGVHRHLCPRTRDRHLSPGGGELAVRLYDLHRRVALLLDADRGPDRPLERGPVYLHVHLPATHRHHEAAGKTGARPDPARPDDRAAQQDRHPGENPTSAGGRLTAAARLLHCGHRQLQAGQRPLWPRRGGPGDPPLRPEPEGRLPRGGCGGADRRG